MVSKRKTIQSFDESTSRLRIDVDELLNILSTYCDERDENVFASSGEYEFSSLKDLEENKEFLTGFPRIQLGRVNLEFGKKKFSMQTYSSLTDREVTELEAVWRKLKRHRDPWAPLLWVETLLGFALLGLIVGTILFTPLRDLVYSEWASPSGYLRLASLTWLVLLGASTVASKRHSVVYVPKQNFWTRNLDTLVVGAIMAVLGGIVSRFI